MATKSYKSDRKHTRVSFTPLDVSCSLVCVTPQSPCSQAANSLNGEYEPNREGDSGTPCVVWPETKVNDRDGIFPAGAVNGRFDLDSIIWYVNDKPISEVSAFTGKYEVIQTANEDRGSLIIRKNVAPSEEYSLSFVAKFEDWRTGTIMTVKSENEMVLKSTDKGDNSVSCSVDTPSIHYDPLEDGLLKYEYLVGKGVVADGSRASYINGKAYERSVNVVFCVGDVKQSTLPTGVSMRLVRKGTTTAITANTESSPEVMGISYPTVKFDLRLIDRSEYEVQFLKGGKIICQDSIGVVRRMQQVQRAFPNKGADIIHGQIMYFNDATVMLNDKAVDYPELYYLIEWFTQARVWDATNGVYKWATPIARQFGERMECEVNSLGIGKTKNDSYFSAYFDVTEDDACQLLADESGVAMTDENGVLLID